jgi:hypothetical protein
LQRLRRYTGAGVLVGVLSIAATTAAAAPAPTLFRVSLTASAQQQWDHTTAPVASGSCERTERSEGIRSATFSTRRSGVLRVVGGRFLRGELKAVAGSVSLVGANTNKEVCGETGMESIADCAPTKRSFGGAILRIAAPGRGVLIVRSVRNIRLRSAQCPREPVEVRRMPLGPLPITFRVSTESLADPRTVRITLRASRSRTTIYPAPQAGTLRERSFWTLSLVRVS